jgi:hypothetical protein
MNQALYAHMNNKRKMKKKKKSYQVLLYEKKLTHTHTHMLTNMYLATLKPIQSFIKSSFC